MKPRPGPVINPGLTKCSSRVMVLNFASSDDMSLMALRSPCIRDHWLGQTLPQHDTDRDTPASRSIGSRYFFDHADKGHRIGFLTAQDSREPCAEQSTR